MAFGEGARVARYAQRVRVIGGEFRSRPLAAPAGWATRPTSDRLRETLANVLAAKLPGAKVADLYAGSGAVGIEMLSRGATQCTFAEKAAPALQSLRKNVLSLSLGERALVEARSVQQTLQRSVERGDAFDLVFLDPPYEAAEEYTSTLAALGGKVVGLLCPESVVVAEHARRTPLVAGAGKLRRFRVLEQGDAALSFYAIEVE